VHRQCVRLSRSPGYSDPAAAAHRRWARSNAAR
jgi:hypothetical protein